MVQLNRFVHPADPETAHTGVAMILQRRRKYAASMGNFYRLHNETTGKQLFGFSFGSASGFAKLKDTEGATWTGTADSGDEGTFTLRFKDGTGQTMSGTSDGQAILMRDSRGRIWKGFAD